MVPWYGLKALRNCIAIFRDAGRSRILSIEETPIGEPDRSRVPIVHTDRDQIIWGATRSRTILGPVDGGRSVQRASPWHIAMPSGGGIHTIKLGQTQPAMIGSWRDAAWQCGSNTLLVRSGRSALFPSDVMGRMWGWRTDGTNLHIGSMCCVMSRLPTPLAAAWDEVFLVVPRLKGTEVGLIERAPRELPTTRWRRVSDSLSPCSPCRYAHGTKPAAKCRE